jgi:hypothetical protein
MKHRKRLFAIGSVLLAYPVLATSNPGNEVLPGVAFRFKLRKSESLGSLINRDRCGLRK